MELSYNNGSMFRSCQKKFYWRYIRHLKPVKKSSALNLGNILHEGFDFFHKGASDLEVYQYIADRFNEEMKKEEIADQEDLLIGKYTALGMWLNCPFKNDKYEAEASEEVFEVTLTPEIKLVGKVDGRIKQAGNWWVRELKTTGMRPRQFEGRCQTSGQSTGYVYGLTKKGFPIQGIKYEYILKPILRKGMRETADSFGRRIMDDYKNRPKFYFNQYQTYRTPTDLRHFECDMILLANDILRTIEKDTFYRNVDQCWNFNQECEYAKICFAEVPDPLTLEIYYTS